jgi:hypothetical protein
MIIIKKIKSLILYCSHLYYKSWQSKIIFYHDVHLNGSKYTDMSTSITVFKSHVDEIRKNGFEIVNVILNRENEIQICFDDGFKGIYDNKDYFVNESIFPTIFLAIDLIGKEGYLSEDNILELQSLGFIFESHAYSHKNLTSFSNADLKFELEESKMYLEALLKKEVKEICFPIGYFSNRVLNFCHKAGYKKLYSSLPGNYFNNRSDGLVYRNLVQFSSLLEFKAILNGAMTPFLGWYKRKQFVNDDENR